jgi:hypothetical protein
MVFHADGTGTANSPGFSIDPGAGSTGDSSYHFTHGGPDDKLAVKEVPGTYSSTILTGPIAGLTQVVGVADTSGLIGEGADHHSRPARADRRNGHPFRWRPVHPDLQFIAHLHPHQRRRSLILVNGGAPWLGRRPGLTLVSHAAADQWPVHPRAQGQPG